ncbi:MAG: putative NRPS-like protein biosynthetic cluster [Cirrosporium novae-zelandiae]|nr:MAG: putative NRPS-like protein biosynthetic cluster [Cirrosporium novae-zelandiae]
MPVPAAATPAIEKEIGYRLLPNIVDDLARDTPSKLYALIPKSANISDGFHEVSYREFADAINSVSWWLEETLGKPKGKWGEQTVGYLGPNDIRYPIFFVALIKAGYKALLTSPRNSAEGFASLIQKTRALTFFHTKEWAPLIHHASKGAGVPLKSVNIPTYAEILASKNASRHYPFTKTYEELAMRPAHVFHTSGSTGLPSPIEITHSFISKLENIQEMPTPAGRLNSDLFVLKSGELFFTPFPAFHVTGAVCMLPIPIFSGAVVVLQPSETLLNEDMFLSLASQLDLTAALLPPSFIEDLSINPKAREQLSKLKYVLYAGGPLSKPSGDRLMNITTVIQMIGSTECGLITSLIPRERKDWSWFEWNPYSGVEMREAWEGLYELVMPKNEKYLDWQCVFNNFPNLDEWRTKDLFRRADHNPNLWQFVGRLDDVIVLSNGEKWNPVSQEKFIEDHPLVRGAVVVGQGRFQVGLIIEPDTSRWDPTSNDIQDLIEEIWPTVKQANDFSAGTGRIYKSMIMVSKPEKPFKRAGKGTIQRAATVMSYEKEIEALYQNSVKVEVPKLPQVLNVHNLKGFIRKCVETTFSTSKLSDDADFYAHGFDSLQTIGLANAMRHAVDEQLGPDGAHGADLSARMVYQHPSIGQLAGYLDCVLNGTTNGNGVSNGFHGRIEKIQAMIDKYTADLVPSPTPATPTDPNNLKVILTGSTGNLGTYFLHFLLSDPAVTKIYCFNRDSNAMDLNQQNLQEKGYSHDLQASSKIEWYRINLADPNFGLSDSTMADLKANTNIIIHNAWAVNFNHTLETFEDPHVIGVRNLIDLSLQSKYRPHIFFISSIAGVSNWAATKGGQVSSIVPEIPMLDDEAALPQGYGESKHVGERMLAIAAEKAGVPSSVGRVGQIGGPSLEKGKWNDAEWVPSIIKTSKSLNKIPATLGRVTEVDWVCIDKMAMIVTELIKTRLETQKKEGHMHDTFHLVNHRWAKWSELIPPIQTYFQEHSKSGSPAEVVPYEEWLGCLERVMAAKPSEQEITEKPALKIMDFLRGLLLGALPVLATEHTKECSKTMAEQGPCDAKLMELWLKQWNY